MTDQTKGLLDQVNAARAANRTLNIVGGGSKSFMGREQSADSTISVASHTGIVSYEPVELVLTARAGTRLVDIEAALSEQGQAMAFEPPHFSDKASLGGTLACNQSGPARPWQGSVRDAVLGVRLINGYGEHLRFGGQVMKNVAGYDVSRAQAGAFGTLGIITEISMKVLPKPKTTLTLVQELDAPAAIQRMNELSGRSQLLAGACWIDGLLYLRLMGSDSVVTATAKEWGGDVLDDEMVFWHSIKEQEHSFFSGAESLWRFSIKPNATHWRQDARWLIDWGGAQRWLRGDFDFATLETEASNAKGQVGLFRGSQRKDEVFATPSPGVKLLHQRLKKAFDPQGIFNPGRLYSWM
ncbi:MAG: glycolate oxidase subunit GlcE [Pseudomonadales bacterium]